MKIFYCTPHTHFLIRQKTIIHLPLKGVFTLYSQSRTLLTVTNFFIESDHPNCFSSYITEIIVASNNINLIITYK